jgi:hypothetical protein
VPAPDLYSNFITVIEADADMTTTATGGITDGFLNLDGYLLKNMPSPYTPGCIYPDDKNDTAEAHHYCIPLRLQRWTCGDHIAYRLNSAYPHYRDNSSHTLKQDLCGLLLRRISRPWGVAYERIGICTFVRSDEIRLQGQKKNGDKEYVLPGNPGGVVENCVRVSNIPII